jgi:hypothetical protein
METSDWISVKDELPEVDTLVLVCTSNGKFGISSMWIPEDCYGNVLGDKKWRGSNAMRTAITHWQRIVLPKDK